MTLQYSTECKNARLDAIEMVIGTAPLLRVYDLTGAAPGSCEAAIDGTVLATFQLPSDWLGSAAYGGIESGTAWTDSSADASGTADFFRIYDNGGGTCYIQGSVGAGAFLTMQNYVIAAGQSLTINSFEIISGNIAGNTYYVDATDGDDDGTGAIGDPWQTIAKVNATTLLPGDRVLFKRGETFAGQLAPTDSGVAGNPIVYSTYGSGARPIIDGSAVNSAFYINDNYHDLRFESLDFSGANGVGYATVFCWNAYNLYFYNCIARDASFRSGFSVNSDVHPSHDITLDTCQAYNNEENGFLLDTLEAYNQSCIHCIAHDNGTVDGDHGFYIGGGVTCDDCYSYDNYDAGYKLNDNEVQPFFYPVVKNSVAYGNKVGLCLTHKNLTVYNNLIYGNNITAQIWGNAWGGYSIIHNTFVNQTSAADRSLNFTLGVSNNSVIKNNIFVQDLSVVTRGIFYTTISMANLHAAYDIDYNTYYTNGSLTSTLFGRDNTDVGNELKSWNNWIAAGHEAHGVFLNPFGELPEFVDYLGVPADYHPVNAGNLDAHSGLAIDGYESDKDGNTRADPPNCGAYEEASA